MNNSRGCLKYFLQGTVGCSDYSKYLTHWNEYSKISTDIQCRPENIFHNNFSLIFCKKN